MNLKIKVAAATVNTTPIDWANNLRGMSDAVDAASKEKVQLLCLPELCVTGYGCEDLFHKPYIRQNALQFLQMFAESCPDGMIITAGLPLEYHGCIYNAVAVIHRKKIKGFYCKRNLAGDGIHYEPRWFKAWAKGDKSSFTLPDGEHVPIGDTIFSAQLGTEKVTIGFEICEDAWVAERPGIELAKAAVDIILNPSASHFAFGKTATRERFVIDGSRAFNCAYIYANLLGNEAGRVIYDGDCLIANGGQLVAKGDRFGFDRARITTAIVDLSINRINRTKSASYRPAERNTTFIGQIQNSPDHPTRGIITENLSKVEEFIESEILGLFDYCRKSRCRGFTISLSGGADSAMCAILVHLMVRKALSKPEWIDRFKTVFPFPLENTSAENVTFGILDCIYESSENSSEHTLLAAKEVALATGAEFVEQSITEIVDFAETFLTKFFKRPLNWTTDNVTRQNLQARVRPFLPWSMANMRNRLLLTTSNRSEAAVGYCTMDGDAAGSLGPLGGVDKEFILFVLDFLTRTDGKLCKAITTVRMAPPSAELMPLEAKQTDEKDLMPYPTLGAIELAMIIGGKSPEEIRDENIGTTDQVKKFFRLFARSQWKRERYAASFHLDAENLDPRSFTRFPILSGGFEYEMLQLDPPKTTRRQDGRWILENQTIPALEIATFGSAEEAVKVWTTYTYGLKT